MKIIKNFALLMLIVFISQLIFNGCAGWLKNYIVKNITISYEDKSEHILTKHRIVYGVIGAWAAYHNKKDVSKGYENGVLAGEIAYFGKKVARKRGLGLVGQAIHSLGVSMLENQILNKSLFSRYRIFLPPISLEADIQEGFRCQILAGSVMGILANVFDISKVFQMGFQGIEGINKNYITALVLTAFFSPDIIIGEIFSDKFRYFKPLDSLVAGSPIFVFKNEDAIFGMSGLNIGGVITVERDFSALSHEMIHSCQNRELAVINLFVERKFLKDFPILFSHNLLTILLIDWIEVESREYDRIYQK